jgi:hypothetical protein
MGKHGEFVTKLIIRFIAREAIPPGGGIADGIEFFKDKEHRTRVIEKAEANAMLAIQLIRRAPDNPFGNDDEQIAQEILKGIEIRVSRGRERGDGKEAKRSQDG